MQERQRPGYVRDAVVSYLSSTNGSASVQEIETAVINRLGNVSPSSVRSCLNLHIGDLFERVERGQYRILENGFSEHPAQPLGQVPCFSCKKSTLYKSDCFDWLTSAPHQSIHAVVTDPPYGGIEYSERELAKLKNGRGGVWRIPPAFDGSKRSPLPRFTVLSREDLESLRTFFERLGNALHKVLVPGANIVIASNPLLCQLVVTSLAVSGLEPRGMIVRLVMTMRGGDRPKNAHKEFSDVSVMPRSMWEPWVVMRRPPEGRIQDNLRKWGTGGFRRISADKPFGDVIQSQPTRKKERTIAPHPSLKPQSFLRQIVRASLPLGKGIVLDPFAGSGSTLAAANAVGYESIGIERSDDYISMAIEAIPKLTAYKSNL